MPNFTPPNIIDYLTHGDPNKETPEDRLFSYFPPVQMAETIWQDQEGTWYSQAFPFHGAEYRTFDDGELIDEAVADGLRNAQNVFLGSHIYHIDDATATELTNAGFGDGINMQDTQLTWTEDELSLLSNQIVSVDGANIPDDPVTDGLVGSFNLQSGNINFSSRRDFWLHDYTQGWTDTHVIVEGIDPLVFDPDHSLGQILPQVGVVLRWKDQGGKRRGITLNNNVIFGLPGLNVGVWEHNLDGTGFANRQFGWPVFESLPMPYGFEAFLEGNIVRVRIFPMQEAPPPWDHPTHARTIDLDVDAGDAGAIPTPTGDGMNGIIAAHLGTHPLAAGRLHRVLFERTS